VSCDRSSSQDRAAGRASLQHPTAIMMIAPKCLREVQKQPLETDHSAGERFFS
jgi:hypothetical protein